MAGEGFPNFDHWLSHQMAQNVSLLGSFKEKSSQQIHMTLWGKETTQQQLELGFAATGTMWSLTVTAKSHSGHAGTTRFTGQWHLG